MEFNWLDIAKRLEAIAQTGLAFTESDYDRERYEEVREIGHQIFHHNTQTPIEVIHDLFARENGYPTPKVDSSVVKIDLYSEPLIPKAFIPDFFTLVKAGFGQKRETLRNALSAGMKWTKAEADLLLDNAGINPQRRAQTLSLEEWANLTIQAAQRK